LSTAYADPRRNNAFARSAGVSVKDDDLLIRSVGLASNSALRHVRQQAVSRRDRRVRIAWRPSRELESGERSVQQKRRKQRRIRLLQLVRLERGKVQVDIARRLLPFVERWRDLALFEELVPDLADLRRCLERDLRFTLHVVHLLVVGEVFVRIAVGTRGVSLERRVGRLKLATGSNNDRLGRDIARRRFVTFDLAD
jgi:hypothetical protein